MKIPAVKFSRDTSGFSKALRQRVEQYFEESGRLKAEVQNVPQELYYACCYFIPWGLITFGVVGSGFWFWVAEVVMGMGLAGIGLNIMHDGNHNSYNSKSWVNKAMGRTLDLVGGC